jgi:hypothetical protein
MKDHKPSPHLVGEQPATFVSGRMALASLLLVVAALVVLNVVFPEPPMVSCDRPAPVVQK